MTSVVVATKWCHYLFYWQPYFLALGTVLPKSFTRAFSSNSCLNVCGVSLQASSSLGDIVKSRRARGTPAGMQKRGGGEKGELVTITGLFFWVIFVVHCVSLNLQYLGQKVLKILHFLTNRMLILIIWYHYGPSPSTTLVNVVQSRSEMVQPDFNIVLGGRGGGICSCQCFPELYLETRHSNVHFSQNNIVVKDCSLKLWFSSNSCVTWSVSA